MGNIGWELPSTNGGREDGLNDSGISYFQANPVKSLTREVIQDSLDARRNNNKPSIVEFTRKDLEREAIPGIDELMSIFETATQFYKENPNETYHFFNKGYDALQKKTVSVLAIRDRNTTGLTKVGETKDSHFHRLTKTTGDTAKTGTSNGSFGIGKHAPFAASIFRAMLYGTLNTDEGMNKGFQGVIKIASYDRGEEFPTQGTGFYGHKKGFLPLTDLSGLDPFFKRQDGDFGTDKFILGFEEKNNWEKIVIEESVSNYMWAIINGSLEIVVGQTVINKDTLKTVIEKIAEFNPKSTCLEFYLTLTSPDAVIRSKEFQTEDGQKETMKLFLLKAKEFNKRVSLIRGTGMKIYEKGHFRTPDAFAGTLIVEGEELNKVVRKMEPPTHDDWKPGLYKKNPKYAEKLKKELYKWLNDEVNAITPKYEKDSLELPGLEGVLPSLNQEENPAEEIDLTSNKEKINSIAIVSNSMNKRDPKARKRKKRIPNPRPTKPQKEPANKITKAEINRMRAFCIDEKSGQYRLVVNPVKSGEALIEVKLIGESITEHAKIYNAIEDQTGNKIEINENVLGPLHLIKGANKTITISLDQVTRYSLEVSAK
ncbi:hypothetical protein [Planococcus salinus]|uniref:Uncharacterized protein n=1 Tax=Planococcus salinus TaxID=1848460 RepID=A0A3M8P7U2_9BACL|nr:hypothetical protein [Planococcus salinus]RNF39759.1 hypothetical protein EEX84_07270 [Planococcus salinus]